VIFGEPLRLETGEQKGAFLDRARSALLALRPRRGQGEDAATEAHP